MSNQPIRAWQDLLQHLSELTDDCSGPEEWLQHCEHPVAAFERVEGLPTPMPRAVLKKFVQEAQVGGVLQTQVVFAGLLLMFYHGFKPNLTCIRTMRYA